MPAGTKEQNQPDPMVYPRTCSDTYLTTYSNNYTRRSSQSGTDKTS